MLVAAHNPPVALHAQTQATPSQRRQPEAYHAHAPLLATPLPVSVPIAVPLPVTVPVPAVVHVPMHAQLVRQAPPPVQRIAEEQEVVPVHERLLAVQLAYLASQHHASDYNKSKFGHKGSTNAYVPLSLQAQPYVCDLRARQARNSEQRAWWISERDSCDTPEKPVVQETQGRTDSRMQTESTMEIEPPLSIQQEISAAISSQIPAAHITKTSQSHPINVSMVIPPEILSAIASRLIVRPATSPFMFHLPESYCLDRVTAIPVPNAQSFSQLSHSGFPVYFPPVRPPVPITWAQHGSVDLLQNALSDELAFPSPGPPFVPSQDGRGMPQLFELPPSPHALPPTPPSPPKGVIRRRPRHGRATSAPPTFPTLKNLQRRNANFKDQRQYLPRPKSDPEMPTPWSTNTPSTVAPIIAASKSIETATDELEDGLRGDSLALPPAVSPNPESQSTPIPAPEDHFLLQRLGNMYLSSCPGKKVRLSGPVKGRGAICRDLRADLMRIRDLRVQCVICCLDDNELDFLGASWSEYSSVANELGLDVLRIPMPEGLAPLSPAWLDTHLTRIIEAYTLRGIHVLAHCRGGVGRAGLVACCWMLKLGLCGWKDPQVCARFCTGHAHMSELSGSESYQAQQSQVEAQIPQPQFQHQQTPNQDQVPDSMRAPANVPRVCRATVRLVERVLAVVRRRRSLKAVETYEQVRFLVEFVEYLDAEARGGRSSLH